MISIAVFWDIKKPKSKFLHMLVKNDSLSHTTWYYNHLIFRNKLFLAENEKNPYGINRPGATLSGKEDMPHSVGDHEVHLN